MTHSIEQAADAITHLINSRVQSPTKVELTAIIAGHFGNGTASPPALPDPDAAVRMDALRAAIAAVEDEQTRTGGVEEETNQPLSDLSEKTYSRPAATLADLQERAMIARHWMRYAPSSPDAPPGPWVNPSDLDDWGDQTVAELVHAVLGFAGELPTPIAASRSPLHAEINRVANEYIDAYDIDGDPRVEPLGARLEELAAQLPQRVSPAMLWPTVADVAAWAEVAFAYACEGKDDEEDPVFHADYPALNNALTNLVTAARVLGSLSPPMEHPLVKEANAVLDAWGDACKGAAAAGNDSAVDAAHDHVTAFARRLWARQPTSPADIVARAIIFENWCAGIDDDTGELTYLDPVALAAEKRKPACDWSAEAHLLDAIRKVLGGRRYSKARGAVPAE